MPPSRQPPLAPPGLPPGAGRPRIHFAAPSGWLNDPNGLIYLDGEYHLFYQHHPASLIWGPMHWGHAVSRDLVGWEHLAIALEPDELGAIFSGSAVLDHANTAGFGAGAMVAIFTHASDSRQVQSLAHSTDRGRTWTKYAGNPVLAPADAPADFRDPRVVWYAGEAGGHWVMALACGQEVWFYTSPDLKAWTKAGVFGAGYGAHSGVWECPELLSLPVDGGPDRRWVLAVGVQQGGPAGGSGTQYFVGAFDGTTFACDDAPGTVRWVDYGADFYASQAWQNAPDGRAIWLAWMNNWDYARLTPATSWRGMMSAPRELALTRDEDGVRLVQRPVPELTMDWPVQCTLHDLELSSGVVPLNGIGGETLLIEAVFAADVTIPTRFGIRVRVSDDEASEVSYDPGQMALSVRRSYPGWPAAGLATSHIAPLKPRKGLIRLQILLDTASVEVFADDGRVTLTDQIFPKPESTRVELFADSGAAKVAELTVWAPTV